ncbi:MAG: hypothetical protein KatS3mg031_1839 [Chitinophagales bacterium]|nr:MAG: hypothetical protein KatS3mg031_1839 [Chitinophagales bacterium]
MDRFKLHQKLIVVALGAFFLLAHPKILAQQITAFSEEPGQLVRELSDFLKASKREDCMATATELTANHKSGKLTSLLPDIRTTANIMLARNMRAYPHFNAYFSAVNHFITSGKPETLFRDWSANLNKVIEAQRRGETKDFMAFVSFFDGLVSQNAIYLSNSKSWFAPASGLNLTYDSVPRAIFSSTDLIAASASDTIMIRGTSGSFLPLESKWVGKGGLIDWSRAGLDASRVYAELGPYALDVSRAEFKIDSVTFYHKDYFDFSLLGSLTDKLVAQKNEISYPRFESYRKDLAIKDITPNVRYVGGFALYGNKVIGTGDDYNKATLEFFNSQGQKIIQAKSKQILLRKTESLSADRAEVSLYMGKDSIYHPGLNIVYKIKLKEINLYRGTEGIAATPFFDSYHQMEIKTDAIVWKVDEPYVNIKMMSGAGKAAAIFTSNNFFRYGELQKFQGVMDFNPISTIFTYATKNQTREILAEDLAKKMNPNYSEATIRGLLYKMVEEGFIFYDEDRGLITVLDKVFNYIAANRPKDPIDYDVIQIQSFSPSLNGIMSFDNKNIDLVGVKEVILSDSQNVFIYPDSQKLGLLQNRNMAFSGKVSAGRIDFTGTGFLFDYDSFSIDLTNLAAALIWVPSGKKDKYGNELLLPMKSQIEGLTGYLNIDKPDNKSGRKNFPNYPIFTNLEKSYVYYDDSLIFGGTYVRDRFYFLLDPFVFDSLDNFNPYLSDFNGEFFSADIFPSFPENLKIQDDLSFGFKRTTPEKGYPLYKGKATFNDSIFLSNQGLRGKGRIKYLFNKIESDSIIFFPDSLYAFAQSFLMDKTIHEGITFPYVKGTDNEIQWYPYMDSMYIRMTDKPFVMYDSATLKGNLYFTKKGLKGSGDFEFREAALASNLFNFQSESLDADTLSLVIKSITEDKVTFNTPNVRGRVDFVKREGEFKSNVENIPTEFANNQYRTSINEFFWDMDGNFLDFKAPPGSEGVYFISTRPDQDSLKFLGKRAFFDMSTSIIRVDSVPEIRVADAKIIPDKKRATILPGGLLDTLKNAVVIFDTLSERNKVYNATVAIQSRNTFTGNGIMDYQISSLKPYQIIIHDMGVKEVKERKKTLYYTYANGTLEEAESFLLHPKITFQGTVSLTNKNKHPYFSGFGLLDLANKNIPTSWFQIADEVNTDTFFLHYDHPLSTDSSRLFTGIFYSPYDSLTTLYASIMNPLRSKKDLRILDTRGILKYDEKNKIFYFGDENKINNGALRGNMLRYEEKRNLIWAEGKLDFNLNLEPIKLTASGSVANELDSNKFTFNTFLALGIPMHKDIIEFFGKDMTILTLDRPNIDYGAPAFEKALAEIADEKRAAKTIEELRKTGQFLRIKELNDFNLIISNVKLIYEPYYQTYRSEGPIGLSYIGPSGIHKYVNGYVELGYRKNNDFFNIYFELDADNWYFISFNNKILQILSSNKDFNMLLASIVPQNRKEELAKEEFYLYTATTYKKMQDFLYRMKLIAQGIKVEQEPLTEEEDFQLELEQIKKELLKIQEDTLTPQPPSPPAGKKGKQPAEEIGFIQEETIPQEQPDYMPVRLEDFLKEEKANDSIATPDKNQPEKKSKKKELREQQVKEQNHDPYAEDQLPAENDTQLPKEEEKSAETQPAKKKKTKEESFPDTEPAAPQPNAPHEEPALQNSDDAPSDFEQIMGGQNKKKKKKNE